MDDISGNASHFWMCIAFSNWIIITNHPHVGSNYPMDEVNQKPNLTKKFQRIEGEEPASNMQLVGGFNHLEKY